MESELKKIKHPVYDAPTNPKLPGFYEQLLDIYRRASGLGFDREELITFLFDAKEIKEVENKKNQLKDSLANYKTTCAKPIPTGEPYYWCLECDKARSNGGFTYAIYCQECFLNSNHDGHRAVIIIPEGDGGFCDCGDLQIIDSKGFCDKHATKEITYEEAKNILGEKFIESFVERFIYLCYSAISLAEIHILENEGEFKPNKVFDACMDAITDICYYCMNECHPAFVSVLARAFSSKLPEPINRLIHDCQDYLCLKKDYKPQTCTCTILELLLRYVKFFVDATQEKFTPVLPALFRDPNFQIEASISLLKYVRPLHYMDCPERRNQTYDSSRIESLRINCMADEKIKNICCFSPYLDNIFYIVEELIKKYSDRTNFNMLYNVVSRIHDFLEEGSKCYNYLMAEKKILLILLSPFKFFQDIKYQHPININMNYGHFDVDLIYRTFCIEALMVGILRRCFAQLFCLDNSEKEQAVTEFFKAYSEELLKSQNHMESEDWNMAPAILRILGYILRKPDLEIDESYISEMFEKYLKLEEATTVELVLGGIIKAFSTRFFLSSVDPHLSFISEGAYYGHLPSYHEHAMPNDVILTQMMLLKLNKDPFKLITDNYFWYDKELRDYFNTLSLDKQSEKFRKRVLKLEEFLFYLVYLIQDESCLVNNLASRTPSIKEYTKAQKSRNNRVKRKLLITLLAGFHQTDIPTIQAKFKRIFWEAELSSFIEELTEQDQKTQKIKLKKDLYKEVDIFSIFGKNDITNLLLSNIAEKNQKEMTIDINSGKFYEDLPDYLYKIQSTVLGDELMDFLSRFILNYEDSYEGLLRPALRLILYRIELQNYLYKKDPKSHEMIKELNLAPGVIDKLKFFLSQPSLKAYHSSVDKILKYYAQSIEKNKENEESKTMDEKKLIALQKKKELEEKFKKQREMFLMKNQDLNIEAEANKANEQNVENERICHICNLEIDIKNELFGYPVLSSAVNYSDSTGVEIFPHFDQKVIFLFNSCKHIFHKKCFDSWSLSLLFRTMQPIPSCPLCKQGYNHFLPIIPPRVQFDDQNKKKLFDELWKKFWEFGGLGFKAGDFQSIINTIIDSLFYFFQKLNESLNVYKLANQGSIYRDILHMIRNHPDFKLPDLTYQPSGFLDYDLIQRVIISSLHSKSDGTEIFEEYLANKIYEKYQVENEGKTVPFMEWLKAVLSDSSKKEKIWQELKLLIFRTTFLEKILNLNGNNENNDISGESLINYSSPENVAYLNSSLPFDEFIIEVVNKELQKSEGEPKLSTIVVKDSQLIQNPQIQSNMFSLPANYLEFTQIYFRKKCDACQKIPSKGDPLICLLCGKVFCYSACDADMYTHADLHHGMTTLYVDVQRAIFLIVYKGLGIKVLDKKLYENSSGLQISGLLRNPFMNKIDNYRFEDFQLSKSSIEYFKDVIQRDGLASEFLSRFLQH